MKKITVATFIVLVCIVAQGCSVPKNEPRYQSTMVYDKGGRALYTIEVGPLAFEFLSNEIAARQKYIGKRVAVEGWSGRAYIAHNGNPELIIYFTPPPSFTMVICEFSKVLINDIAKISSEQKVIVIGTVSAYFSIHRFKPVVSLEDCILAQPALF